MSVGDRSRMNLTKPPKPGQRKRIQSNKGRGSKQVKPRRTAQHGWFWETHEAAAEASSQRWDTSLVTLRARRDKGLAITSAAKVAEISTRWRDLISAAARKHRVSEVLLIGVITAESLGNAKARSPKGAEGLMQLIPATAARFGVVDSLDAAQNIDGGAAYLSFLLERFNDDPILALAGYNAGENAVDKHSGVPPYTETRDYIPKVIDAIAAAETLCLVAPAGPRRTCLWRPSAGS
ncbi:MAG: lytic transglycosylase domain-containing protein [Pseudomonadota bacterium]